MRNLLRGLRETAAQPAFVPGEDVLLLSVPLPPMPVPQRRAAVAFAVEDRIACALDAVHVVLGPALPDLPGHWLVAVIGRGCLAAHLARLGPGARVVPDTLTVPVPPPGVWAAREAGGRVLLRMADGTGLAVPAEMLGVLHQAAGAPGILLHGGVLPEGVPCEPASEAAAVDLPAGFDLRKVSVGGGVARLMARVAAVVALAGAVHLSLLWAETLILSRQLAAQEAALRAVLARAGLSTEGDPAATLAAAAENAAPDSVLGLLAQAMAALQPLSGQVSLRDLLHDGRGLSMTLQAPDLGALLAAQSALTGAALTLVAGPAATADGLAEQQVTVQR